MARKTVMIITSKCPTPRLFHLEESKAERFAAKIRAEGGTAEIGPLELGTETIAMLHRASVNADRIR